MSCAIGCVRMILFIFNFLFSLCGLALLIPGILIETNIGKFDAKTAEDIHQLQGAAIALIVIGSIIFVIAFFGCCGAIRESHCMTVTYAVFLLIILVSQVVIAVLAFMALKNVDDNSITNGFKGTVNKYWTDGASRTGVDLVQETLRCCGADGPGDYNRRDDNPSMNGTIPWSCCTHDKGEEPRSCSHNEAFAGGCGVGITRSLRMVGQGMGGVALGIAGIELVGIIFALCLANSIRNEDRRNYRV